MGLTAARNRLLYIYMYVCMVDPRPIVVTATDVTCVYMADCPYWTTMWLTVSYSMDVWLAYVLSLIDDL